MSPARRGAWAVLGFIVCAGLATAAHAASAVRLIGQGLLERSGPGLDQTCRIELSPAEGVTSLEFVVNYDPDVVEPLVVYRTAMTQDFTLDAYLDTPGTIEINLAGDTALSGSGDVAWVVFRVIGDVGSTAALTWGSAVLNGGAIASTTQVVRNLVVGTSDVTVSVPEDLQVQAASTVVVDISATAFPSTPDFEVNLRFNPLVAQVIDVQKTSLTSPLNLVWSAPNGLLQAALYGTAFVSGSGPILRVTFQVTGAVGGHMPLNLERARIQEVVKFTDDGSMSICPASCSDGSACTLDTCVLGQCVYEPLTAMVCRPSGGDCDVAESCDDAGECPDDAYASAASVCRPSTGPCDPAESCTGSDAGCPDDVVFPFDAPPTSSPTLAWVNEGEAAMMWLPLPDATSYDAVRGDLAALANSGGDFSLATGACLGADLNVTSLADVDDPPPDTGFWYLVRPANCAGRGSYDSAGSGQVASRDAGIAASASACPE